MSLPHYFLQEQIISRETQECFALALSADDRKHMKVARVAPSEHIAVIDASNDYFECEIVAFNEGMPLVRICQKLSSNARKAHVTLAQGLAKGDKMDLVIRHATELGVDAFVPLKCKRSVIKLDEKKATERMKRWESIVKSAAMQSGQTRLAQVHPVQSVKQFCATANTFDAIFICWEEAPVAESLSRAFEQLRAARALNAEAEPSDELAIAVVVGPEGGIDSEEISLLTACENAHLVSLGSSILRTETAGIVAPALVLYELGQLGGKSRKDTP